ncbi:MAG: MucR family transcriptional regulator [Rhodospirillaceae bacterium]|jgi:predicted transcriptional regulator|nr:MucR family transcriptional regulator [Rhodospirillaceae bacterium]MBT3627875.1 MucR family transcriptional regulator [Rhodospirillaceae bacterium]MBT3925785.1 MucR family transcriptional regulator [Rhodospirillaceae bacterium]MBT4426846.1 MucR family transcriptional regulator [Rhodospirillaceae bacterium]MBT5039812.1 MucR family transcriptional regulator [Rhodospirillaceae bacterium]
MPEDNENNVDENELLRMTAEIVAAYVGNNSLSADQVPEIVRTVGAALRQVDQGDNGAEKAAGKPAVPIRRSITPDYIICLEDGRKLKMLKRHLRTTFGLTPDEYRARWGLPADYPMVAPNYAKRRSEFAKKIGLGQKRSEN